MKRLTIGRKRRSSDIGEHLTKMLGETIASKPLLIVELGTVRVNSTYVFSKAAEISNSEFISVDINDCSKVCEWPKWRFIQSDSIEFADKFKQYCTDNNILAMIDVILIDTYHSYKQVLGELKAWSKYFSKNVLIMCHDTNPQNMINRNIIKTEGGVMDAVNEFFDFKLTKGNSYDTVLQDDRCTYYVSHTHTCHGMLYIRRIRK